MSVSAGGAAKRGTPAFLTVGFRPFFLAASFWAVAALAMWIVVLTTGLSLPSRFDPLSWHIHEMLFGFVLAAIAGFLLTAIPNWTGRQPVRGAVLAMLAALWLIGRITCLVSAFVPPWPAIAADMSFPVILVGIVAREIVSGHSWRNLPMIAPVTVLAIADLLMDLEANDVPSLSGLGWRLGITAIMILISVVAGRIVPSFTRNWLTQRRLSNLPPIHATVEQAALGILHAGLLGWAFFPGWRPIGLLLILGATLNLWRLLRWRGAATATEPLLLFLHIGYGWLVLGTGLLGVSVIVVDVPLGAPIHALTAGAVGTMILAVMTRVARGHTGRDLSADRVTSLIYVLVSLAAIARIVAAFDTDWPMPILAISAGFWIAAFATFLMRYWPMLFRPRKTR